MLRHVLPLRHGLDESRHVGDAMNIIEFPEQTTVYAQDQPEYLPLPAHRFGDREGRIAFCWSLTWRERLRVLFTGRLWHQVLTFNQPLQPQLMTVEKPEMRTVSAGEKP